MSKYNLTDILEQYQIGSGWTNDFDYEGMLNAGLKTRAGDDIEKLKEIFEDFTDVNYHREAEHLSYAIDALENDEIFAAEGKISDFHAEIRKTMEGLDMDTSDDLGAFMASKMEEGEAVDLAIEASQKKAGIEVDESFKSLAKKLDKQKGIDKDEAAKIAGSIAAKKAAGAGKGPTAKQKKRMNEEEMYDVVDKASGEMIDDDLPKRMALALAAKKKGWVTKKSQKKKMNEVRIDRDVANKIEGMLSRPLKAQFLDAFDDIWEDLTEDDMFYPEDVINHLNNEMHKRLSLYRTPDPKPEEIPMFKGTRDALDDISIRETDAVNFNMKADTDYDEGLEDIEEIDSTLDPYEDRDEIIKQVMSLLIKEKGASREELKGFIETHIEDILNARDDDAVVDEFTQYLSVNEGDKALKEHFSRFMKDYQ